MGGGEGKEGRRGRGGGGARDEALVEQVLPRGPCPLLRRRYPHPHQGSRAREPEPPELWAKGCTCPSPPRTTPRLLGHSSLVETSRLRDEGCTRVPLPCRGPRLLGPLPALSILFSSGQSGPSALLSVGTSSEPQFQEVFVT